MTSTTTSTKVTKQQKKKQTEYHLSIYKGDKTYVWINAKNLTKEEMVRIANRYFKTKADNLTTVILYRLGKNLYSEPVYRSIPCFVVCRKD